MGKVIIAAPDKILFKTRIRVRISEINYAGHLGYDRMLGLFQEARARFLVEKKFTELNSSGPGLVVRDVSVLYKREVFYGQTLEFKIGISGINARGFDFIYIVTDAETNLEAARGRTGMVFFDYHAGKSAGAPKSFFEKMFSGVDFPGAP